MGTPIEKIIQSLPRDRQAKIAVRTTELVEEERTLRQLREGVDLTQNDVAERLEMAQGNMSRLEQRGDLKISTVRSYVEALGGKLRMVAEFPGRSIVLRVGGKPMKRRVAAGGAVKNSIHSKPSKKKKTDLHRKQRA